MGESGVTEEDARRHGRGRKRVGGGRWMNDGMLGGSGGRGRCDSGFSEFARRRKGRGDGLCDDARELWVRHRASMFA